MSEVSVTVGDRRLSFALDTANAPGLSAALLSSLPHSTLAVHCQTAGAEFCVPVPWFHWHENRRPPQTGDVGYASFGSYLCFYYGAMHAADGPTNVIGRLVSPNGELAELGRALLAGGAQRARVGAEHAPGATEAPLPALPPDSSSPVVLARELLVSALAPRPADIDALRRAALPAMGNIAGRLQTSTLLLAIAEVLFMARWQVLATQTDVAATTAAMAAQLERYGRWLAMAGMSGTGEWISRFSQALRGEVLPPAQLVAGLEEALVAFGRLRFWSEAISPWHRVGIAVGPDRGWIDPALLQ